jgi:aryl-alcohol dehydrogenase-like predicted oxidoreductase
VELVELGDSGLRVSRVGLGCNNFGARIDSERTRAVVEAALEVGITFLDTADVYGGGGGSERMLGEILAGRRDSVVLATKFGYDATDSFSPRGSPENVRRSIEGSLERLRTDYVDLYYLHSPDPMTPIGETLSALDELVRAGKVRAIGCSNVSAERLAEADAVAREGGMTRFTAVQNEYNLLERKDDARVLPLCRELGIGYVPYFPLASGLLTGKYRPGTSVPEGARLAGREFDDKQVEQVEVLAHFAEERGHTLLELAISALASTPAIASVIAGATSPEHVRANAAAGSWEMSAEELDQLSGLAHLSELSEL